MSGGNVCLCADRSRLRVVDRNCNHSAFNGYHRTWSAYSSIVCLACGGYWRTKAAYVIRTPDIGVHERGRWMRGE